MNKKNIMIRIRGRLIILGCKLITKIIILKRLDLKQSRHTTDVIPSNSNGAIQVQLRNFTALM